MERMRAEREGGRERSPVQNRCCFVRLLEFYVPTYPANYVAPPFPSLCISSATAKHSVPCPLFYRPNRI